jgi:hypothetical protein
MGKLAWADYDHATDLDSDEHESNARAALEAADAVMFSDEAIERAAKAVHDLGAYAHSWDERAEDLKELYREDARAVIAALKGDGK